jgi:hypothetical protein
MGWMALNTALVQICTMISLPASVVSPIVLVSLMSYDTVVSQNLRPDLNAQIHNTDVQSHNSHNGRTTHARSDGHSA